MTSKHERQRRQRRTACPCCFSASLVFRPSARRIRSSRNSVADWYRWPGFFFRQRRMTCSSPAETAGFSTLGCRWLPVLNGVAQFLNLRLGERQLAGRHLVEHRPSRPQVACAGRRCRQIAPAPCRAAVPVSVMLMVMVSSEASVLRGIEHFGQAEIEDLQGAILGDAQVSRLQVAMDDALAMRGFQARWPTGVPGR